MRNSSLGLFLSGLLIGLPVPLLAADEAQDAQSDPTEQAEQQDLSRLHDSAVMNLREGRVEVAERLLQTGLASASMTARQPEQALTIALTLAAIFESKADYVSAEAVIRTALGNRIAAGGVSPDEIGKAHNNLAGILRSKGDLPGARLAVETAIRTLGEGSDLSRVGVAYDTLGGILQSEGDQAGALVVYDKALAAFDEQLPKDGSLIPLTRIHIAGIYIDQSRFFEAEGLLREARSTLDQLGLAVDHPIQLEAVQKLSFAMGKQRRYAQGESLLRPTILALLDPRQSIAASLGTVASDAPRLNRQKYTFQLYLELLRFIEPASDEEYRRLGEQAFLVAQAMTDIAAGEAMSFSVSKMAAGRNTPLSQWLLRRTRLTTKLLETTAAHNAALTAGDLASQFPSATLGIQRELATLDEATGALFPEITSLIGWQPLPVAEVQRQLSQDQALLLTALSGGVLYRYLVTSDDFVWAATPNQSLMLEEVRTLRCQLDDEVCDTSGGEGQVLSDEQRYKDRQPRYDLFTANNLYQAMFGGLDEILRGKENLFLTTSANLGDVPWNALVATESVETADDSDPVTLGGQQWLTDRFGLTVLPSVSALRPTPIGRTRPQQKLLVGYGNPVLIGNPSCGGSQTLDPADSAADRLRSLCPLPGTKLELQAAASLFQERGLPTVVRLGAENTEQALMGEAALDDASVLMIASHGLLASEGDFFGLREPALVMTPPAGSSSGSDGALTASEIVGLKISADIVILSACNTGLAESDSLSLSSLARAFFTAGGRALLATSWRVSDASTAALTVEFLRNLERPSTTRAGALRLAMKSVQTGRRADGTMIPSWETSWAHPKYWAAFNHISFTDEASRAASK